MKRINILITDEQHRRLKEYSESNEVSISEQIRRAIDHGLVRVKPSHPKWRQADFTAAMPEFKKCIKCGIKKPISEFDEYDLKRPEEAAKYPYAYYSDCKECSK